ncbi:MAG: DUF898 family protein [Sphingomonadales bacterium]|jgi:uncharacterized membrane protein YjgN (DUF898 family)|nr:DUF898 family protein [Sphingomonadales bacterium]
MGIGNQDETAFEFTGSWKEFAPIALTNAVLSIVTLSFYRFWAITRERQYLWSHSRFIDDHLEWTGTGVELFKGFLLALILFGGPWLILTFGVQALVLQGYTMAAGILGVLAFLLLIMLPGFAKFRALRFRLSRTHWHGIRGGSDDPGIGYAFQTVWRTVLGYIPLTLMIPWSMTTLWKKRWDAMSFGPHNFVSNPSWEKMLGRYVICALLAPLLVVAVAAVVALGASAMSASNPSPIAVGVSVVVFYAAFFIIPIAYYAAFFREGVDTLELSTLEFRFTARTKDWLILFLGHGGLGLLALLVAGLIAAPFIATTDFSKLGASDAQVLSQASIIGLAIAYLVPFSLVMPFIRYRNWRFFMRHMEAGGEIDLAALTQSTTRRAAEGEGLLDALDVGAF